MKEAVAYCRTACAKESDPSAEVLLQEQMVRRYADARGHFAWPQRGKWVDTGKSHFEQIWAAAPS